MRLVQLSPFLGFWLCAWIPGTLGFVVNEGTDCYLYPESLSHSGLPVDDSPSILQAFELCGTNGTVTFTAGPEFNINQAMNTTGLANCAISLLSELRFSTNVPYWLTHSLPVTLQDQHTAWLIGGENVTFTAGPDGWVNGQGQTWYDENQNNSNQPGRPIVVTFINSTNLFVDGLRVVQPMFWAFFVSYSSNVTMNNIYVNATSDSQWGTVNTDGADTWNSYGVFLTNWTVTNGDDCIAAKGNTSNLIVRNATCHGGDGMTIGSIGQYPLTPDYNTDTVFEDVRIINASEGAYIKTWQGVPAGASLNGDSGGGGSGVVNNITFRNFVMDNVALPIQISQCIYTEGGANASAECETSRMAISNVTWQNITGTSRYNIAASIHCAAAHPCPGIHFRDVNLTSVNSTLGLPMWNASTQTEIFQCGNIVNENSTSDVPCNRWAPSDFGQTVTANL